MQRRPWVAGAFVAVAALATVVVVGGTARASEPSGYETISVFGQNSCLDVADETYRNNGGKVQSYRCNGSDNQRWEFRTAGQDIVQIRDAFKGNKCLDADNAVGHPLGHVQVWDCLGSGQTNQLWRVGWSSAGNFSKVIVNVAYPNRCLEADWLVRDGWPVFLGSCDDATAHWSIAETAYPPPPPPWR